MGIETAVIGGAVLGAAGSLGGAAMGAHAANKASKRASAQSAQGARYAEENIYIANNMSEDLDIYANQGIDIAQGMLDDWEATFGGIEQNLSDYYNNLDPVKFSQEQKTAYSQQLDKSLSQYREGLAQRGMMTSGMRNQLEREAMFNKAKANAGFDINAPEQVAQMKQGWLAQGANQKTNALSSMINANNNAATMKQTGYNAQMNANTNIGNLYAGQAAQAQQSATGFMQGAGSLLGAGLSQAGNAWGTYQAGISSGNIASSAAAGAESGIANFATDSSIWG